MLITNLPPDRHLDAIIAQMQASCRADLMVSYVQQSGVRALRAEIVRLCDSGGVRMICSFDMGITDPEAVRELKNIGAEVRIFQAKRGSFHPKVWLFEGPNQQWNCLVGSANFTAGAMFNNVEVSILLENGDVARQARDMFNKLWGSEECHTVDDDALTQWVREKRGREDVARQIARAAEQQDDGEGVRALEQFVSNWIDIGVHKTTKGAGQVIGKQWRGWYIIPDHGNIDDVLMSRLAEICRIIAEQGGGRLDISKNGGPPLGEILKITEANLKRKNRKMTPRDLFIRQEKNYLVQLGLAHAPNKGELILSRHGEEAARDNKSLKIIYTDAMEEYTYNGLNLLNFTRRLLAQTRWLDFIEFSFFACHAWTLEEINIVSAMIHAYRSLPENQRNDFVGRMNTRFAEKLEPTAKDVKMNYDKNVRHTMSALGWCEGLRYDPDEKKLDLMDGE